MDFRRLEWGRGSKDTAVDKQRKVAVTADNNALRSFRKGCGASAKQRWGRNARWGHSAKVGLERKRVRSDRKGFHGSGVETQKDEPKPVLMRPINSHFPLPGKVNAIR